MSIPPTPFHRVALRLGAQPADLEPREHLLGFVLDRAALLEAEELPAVFDVVSSADPSDVLALADRNPDTIGGLVDRAVEASTLRRPLAVARLRAGLAIGPEDGRSDRGLVLPPAVRSRLAVRLVIVEDIVLVAERGGAYALVGARHFDEYVALHDASETLSEAESDAIAEEFKRMERGEFGPGPTAGTGSHGSTRPDAE